MGSITVALSSHSYVFHELSAILSPALPDTPLQTVYMSLPKYGCTDCSTCKPDGDTQPFGLRCNSYARLLASILLIKDVCHSSLCLYSVVYCQHNQHAHVYDKSDLGHTASGQESMLHVQYIYG